MQIGGALDFLPLWGVFVTVLLLVLLSIEGGYRLGRYRHKSCADENGAPVGAMVAALLGLLAFLLAFTFGLAANRFDARRQLVLDEANAIGTTYLRSEFLAEPHRGEVRKLLREYVNVRLEGVQSGDPQNAKSRSVELHARLWAHAVAAAEKNPSSIVVGLFVTSLNEVIDLHSKRVAFGMRNRIPGTIWAALGAVACLALAAMGYHSGLTGSSRSLAILAVAITFSAVIWLIADLDRPQEGSLQVSQQAMIELRESMIEPKP